MSQGRQLPVMRSCSLSPPGNKNETTCKYIMYVFITFLVLFLVLFSSACLYMTVCIDLCALTPPVCGLSFISIKFCSVLFPKLMIKTVFCDLRD